MTPGFYSKFSWQNDCFCSWWKNQLPPKLMLTLTSAVRIGWWRPRCCSLCAVQQHIHPKLTEVSATAGDFRLSTLAHCLGQLLSRFLALILVSGLHNALICLDANQNWSTTYIYYVSTYLILMYFNRCLLRQVHILRIKIPSKKLSFH